MKYNSDQEVLNAILCENHNRLKQLDIIADYYTQGYMEGLERGLNA